MARLFALLSFVALTGCASAPQLSRDEWFSMTTSYVEAEPEKVVKAAERVLQLADETDTRFQHAKNGFSATRQATTFVLVAVVDDYFHWQVAVEPEGSGSRITAQVGHSASSIMAAPVAPGVLAPLTTGQPVGNPVQDAKLYELFFKRVQHIAAGKGPWLSCEAFGASKLGMTALALCGVGSEDRRP